MSMTYDRFPEHVCMCALGCSMGSCPRNGLDLLIYSACVSWPSSHTHPMTKCVFHFKCSLVALRLKNGSLQTHTHTHKDAGRSIDKWIHTHHWTLVEFSDTWKKNRSIKRNNLAKNGKFCYYLLALNVISKPV